MLNKEFEVAKIKFQNKTFWIGVIISFATTILFCVLCEYLDVKYTTTDIVAIFSVIILVSTLFFTSKAYIQAHNMHQQVLGYEKFKFDSLNENRLQEIEIRKKKYTFQVTEEWYKPGLAEKVNKSRLFLLNWEKKITDGKRNEKEISNVLKNKPQCRLAIITILNYFEHVSILIKEDFIDEVMIRKTFRFLFITYYQSTKVYIEQIQEEYNDQSIHKYFVEYAQKWLVED